MGAGSKSYREMDTAMELHTGSMGASIHMYVSITVWPSNDVLAEIVQRPPGDPRGAVLPPQYAERLNATQKKGD